MLDPGQGERLVLPVEAAVVERLKGAQDRFLNRVTGLKPPLHFS